MKKIIITTVFLVTSGLIVAQGRANDEAAINKQVDAMIYSWNNHDYNDLKNYTTENTDWVNVAGTWWKGRKASQYAHQVFHDTFLKESQCGKRSVAIRFITKDVAIAHLEWHFTAIPDPYGKKEPGPLDCIATLVYVKQNGKWLMEAGENVTIVHEVQQDDPAKQMPEN
jgi:uncharacterized protein (TIGR02246 family)